MQAEIEVGYDRERKRLSDIVPLEAPFSLFITPSQRCNFKCFYCTHSKDRSEKEMMGFQETDLSDELCNAIISQAKEFQGKIKRIVFTGLGEPLMNSNLPEMIKKCSEAHIAGGYEIITNAYLLSHEMTNRLLEAGLTYLRVSIQGLTAEKYREVTGVAIDYSRLLDNLSYFFTHKDSCKVYLKIMDTCLESKEEEKQFYQMFGNLCDKIYIEHLVKAQPSMMDHYEDNVTSELTFFGEPSQYREVCPYLFYVLQLDVAGNVYPCPPLGFPESFSVGNIKCTPLKDIWYGKKLYDLQRLHLTGQRCSHEICGLCENYRCFTPPEDNLDEEKESILRRLEERGHV